MTLILKDPVGALDYSIDWGSSYLCDGDAVMGSTWSVLPVEAGGVRIDGSDYDAAQSRVNVSGGRAGKIYRLINHVVTSLGREDSRSIIIRVEDR